MSRIESQQSAMLFAMKSTLYYDKNAQKLSKQYNGVKFDDVHRRWKQYVPEKPGLACDIGAGTGRWRAMVGMLSP